MKILIIGPLPKDSKTPWNGNTLPIKLMIDEFREDRNNEINIVNTGRSGYDSGFSFRRISEVIKTISQIPPFLKNVDVIYLSIAESFFGNFRDLIIYLLCLGKLDKMVIQLLGGANMKNILKPRPNIFYWANKYFIRKLKGVIVEGETQANIFNHLIETYKIHIIPNFAQNYLFNEKQRIIEKFENKGNMKILFLSNLLYGKGHQELIDAFLQLEDEVKNGVQIDFAGGFSDDNEKEIFTKKIKDVKNLKYHGPVNGEFKKELYHNAHIFCLPTYYPYEGQPFSIIEAYAAGCVVITTTHSGIGYIFKNNINGYEVEKENVKSLRKVIELALVSNDRNKEIALNNHKLAVEKYQEKKYLASVKHVFSLS